MAFAMRWVVLGLAEVPGPGPAPGTYLTETSWAARVPSPRRSGPCPYCPSCPINPLVLPSYSLHCPEHRGSKCCGLRLRGSSCSKLSNLIQVDGGSPLGPRTPNAAQHPRRAPESRCPQLRTRQLQPSGRGPDTGHLQPSGRRPEQMEKEQDCHTTGPRTGVRAPHCVAFSL